MLQLKKYVVFDKKMLYNELNSDIKSNYKGEQAMARNPMQRKAQNSFLLGMLLTVLITGIVIAFLFVQLNKVNNQLKEFKANRVSICVLKNEVQSGHVITDNLVKTIEVDKTTIPANAIGTASSLATYSLETANGLQVTTNENGELVIPDIDEQTGQQKIDPVTNQPKFRVINTNGEDYFYQDTGVKIDFITSPIIAKVDMKPNTILTDSLIVKSSEKITDDVRAIEYNMFTISQQIENEQYVDLRLRLPDGSDYIVATHKKITIPQVEGVDAVSTMILNVNELEILQINSAIVEAYQIEGSKLYVTQYVEPGMQEAAKETYVPSNTIRALIERDPNCVEIAKNALYDRLYAKNSDGSYSGDFLESASQQRQPINNALNGLDQEEAQDQIIDKVQEEITKTQEERQKYLESLGI